MRFLPRLLLAAVCAALVLPGSAPAQSSTGTISGTVVDAGGAPLPGAGIVLRNVATGATRSSVTQANGSFTVPLLPVGTYEVTATLAGFEEAKLADVALPVGGDISVRLTLRLAGVAAQVVVTSEAPLVETTRSQVSSVVNEISVANLPTNGRNFIDFVLTTPGVTKDTTRLGDISFAGQRGTLNSLVIDGADNNNNFFGQTLGRTGSGRAPYQFSQDAVKEFQVNTNAYSAEYGRAGGAVINVVTKSGTNEFHGSAFEFYRDKALNANDYINVINGRPKGPYHFDQFGASLGGPVLRDKLFFFASYDGQRNSLEQPVILNTSGLPNDAATQAALAQLAPLIHPYDRGQDQDVFLLKGDLELGETGHVSVRYNRQEFTGKNNESGGTNITEEHSGNSLVTTDTLTASITSSFSTTFYNELRGQWAKDSEPGLANSDRPEALIRGAAGGPILLQIGRNFFSPRETTITKYQVADTATLLFGDHTLKAGFDLNRDLILNYFPGNFGGSYSFDTFAQFSTGRPTSYLQAFAGPGTTGPYTNPDVFEIGAFVQDEWRATPELTLNLGVRYDWQGLAQGDVRNPDPQLLAAGLDTSLVPEDGNNFGLRLGAAWTPKGSSRTVVRGGYGMFYGRTPAIMVGTAHSNNGINVQTLTFTGAAAPTYPNRFDSIPTGGTASRPSIFVFDPDFENPFVHQASVGVEHGVADDIAVGVSYLYVRGTNLQRSIDINLGSPSVVTFTDNEGNTYPVTRYGTDRPFASFNRVIQFQSTAKSSYNGLTLDIQKRYSNHWQGRIAYTFGKVLDNKPDATAVVPGGSDDAKYAQDARNLDDSYGPGDADQRHRLVLSGYWNLDYFTGDDFLSRWVLGGWSLSGILTVQSGQPYSAIVTADLNNDGNSRNDRTPGYGRNTFNYPLYVSLDPRITKEFDFKVLRLQLIAEAFNVLNRSNVTNSPANASVGVQNVLYNVNVTNRTLTRRADFQNPMASAGPRIVQLAAKIVF